MNEVSVLVAKKDVCLHAYIVARTAERTSTTFFCVLVCCNNSHQCCSSSHGIDDDDDISVTSTAFGLEQAEVPGERTKQKESSCVALLKAVVFSWQYGTGTGVSISGLVYVRGENKRRSSALHLSTVVRAMRKDEGESNGQTREQYNNDAIIWQSIGRDDRHLAERISRVISSFSHARAQLDDYGIASIRECVYLFINL